MDALEVIWRLQWSCVRWLLLRPGQMPDIAVVVERYRGAFNAIRPVAAVLPEMQRAAYEASLQDWKEKGLSQRRWLSNCLNCVSWDRRLT